jgi:hypothetical protein
LAAVAAAPAGTGYVQLDATFDLDDGAVGRLEAGLRPFRDTTIFAFGQLDRSGPSAGVGARWDF